MKKYLRNENGSTYLVIFGIMMVGIILSLVLFDFSSVFMTKRVSQTSADAASLAAAQK